MDDASSITSSKVPPAKVDCESMEEFVNSQGVRFTSMQQHTPYGSLCIRELFRFLVSLCSPLDKQNTEIMMHLGLSLLQVTLEVAADALSNFPSLLALCKDDLTRNLILVSFYTSKFCLNNIALLFCNSRANQSYSDVKCICTNQSYSDVKCICTNQMFIIIFILAIRN